MPTTNNIPLHGLDALPADALATVLALRRDKAGLIFDPEFADLFVEVTPALAADLPGWRRRLATHRRQIIDFMASQPGYVPQKPPPAIDAPDAELVEYAKRLVVRDVMKGFCRRRKWIHVKPTPSR